MIVHVSMPEMLLCTQRYDKVIMLAYGNRMCGAPDFCLFEERPRVPNFFFNILRTKNQNKMNET